MTTRQIPTGTMAQLQTALPQADAITLKAPNMHPKTDLMELIQECAPNKDGINLLYSVAGGLEFRIARLAAMVTNVMAATLLERSITSPDDTAIGKMNEALNALDEVKNRDWSFGQAGLAQRDMLNDLTQLVNFNTTVQTQVTMVKSNGVSPAPIGRGAQHLRWTDVISLAAKPMAVEEWKYELSWAEYVEGCKGKTEMTEAEHRVLESVTLAGKQQDWALYAKQIIETIEACEDEPIELTDLSIDQRRRLLVSISSEDKEAKLRSNCLKIAKNPSDLHVRRQFVSSFMTAARLALTHPKFDESYAEPDADSETAANRSDARHTATAKQAALDSDDSLIDSTEFGPVKA